MTTWVASAFLVGLLVTAAAGRGTDGLLFALNPLLVASVGWIMLWRDRPSAAAQLVVGMTGFGLTVGVIDPGLSQSPTIGFLAMGVVGTLFVRTQLKLFILFSGVGMALVALAQAADEYPPRSCSSPSRQPLATSSWSGWFRG